MSAELTVRSAQTEDIQAWLTLWRGYCAAQRHSKDCYAPSCRSESDRNRFCLIQARIGEGLVHRIDDEIADLPFSEMGDDQGNGAR
jgi:hypothetical protein